MTVWIWAWNDFFALNFIPHHVPQSFSASRSLWNWIWSWMDLMFLYTRQSSANKRTWVWGSTTDGRSLMNNRKSNSPMLSVRFHVSLPWGTLSKAFAKSKIPTSVYDFTASLRMRRSWIVRIKWVSHEWYFLKPWLYGLRAPYLSRWDLRCEQMMCSSVLQGMHVKLTGL